MTLLLLPPSSPHGARLHRHTPHTSTQNHDDDKDAVGEFKEHALLQSVYRKHHQPRRLHHLHRVQLPFRRNTQLVLLLATLFSVYFGLNLFFHQSIVAVIQEDFYAVEDSSTANNETWNASRTLLLPPPPWPTESDGCLAEDQARPYCQFHNLLIDLSRINSASIGGESLFAKDNSRTRGVMGQSEQDEYLVYQPGAFRLFTNRNPTLPPDNAVSSFHYVNDVLNSLQIINVSNESSVTVRDRNCTSYFYGTTLFLQRYEYVNLYHTLTDWWNTWTVYRYLREHEIAHFAVIFLDAHPAGNLDAVWTTLFGNSIHVRRLDDDNLHPKQTERLCFQRALLVPPGYISHLWPEPPPNGGMGDNRTHVMMKDFVDFVLDKLRLTHVRKIPGHVVMIDRKPYLAHPRSRSVEDRALNNLQEVAAALLQNVRNVTSVRIVQLHNMTFREQVEAVRQAEVLVGNHGAGLSHLVFMDDASHVVEFQMNNLNFFVHLAQCKSGRVTLHQLPDVRGSVSDAYLHNHLLPKFANIYGLVEILPNIDKTMGAQPKDVALETGSIVTDEEENANNNKVVVDVPLAVLDDNEVSNN